MRALIKSFSYAFKGISYCIKNERNMRIHLTTVFYMFLLSGFFELTRNEYIILIILSAIVISMEILNTSIETIMNMLSPSYDHLARIAKDTAAGAVFISAFAAFVTGVIIFLDIPSFIRMYDYFTHNIIMLVLLLLSFIISVAFVFCGPNTLLLFIKGKFRGRQRP